MDDDLRSERIAELEKSRQRWTKESAAKDQEAAAYRDLVIQNPDRAICVAAYIETSEVADAACAYASRVVDRMKRLRAKR